MSFIQNEPLKPSYQPGWFLADDENCTRITMTIPAESDHVIVNEDGTKYVPMGTVFAAGILYEDVDVSTGDMPGSLVIAAKVYEDRLVGDTEDLTNTDIILVGDAPVVIRPTAKESDDKEDE